MIFFARYEASEWGSPYIEPEHLVLGLLRESHPLLEALLLLGADTDDLKRSVEATLSRGDKIPTSVDLPLSHPSQQILAYSVEEAERAAAKQIGPEYILLGILRESESTAATVLTSYGLSVERLRRKIAVGPVISKGDVLGSLRQQFGPLALRLTPEVEPMTIFSLKSRVDE